ncbi:MULTISPECIES: ACP S-malonyltransferase [unclassified Enterococcus]|uniref:ACP S-malonyltransferase n=1 Tax=unclassified Enterococcus TaxID=2608891 RepID=UPI001556AED4|nr:MULTISPECIES: ACP S-malonyltransferase [unclassified Enterococcus]MBS7577293.1 ACP S-malonyltransferase [Enterococcus sp. MMGLQ5-2]MBS7584614.1 ACP S-malonyltransferase [Enterococcus sp. MMGLQ5-1]NPD12469.1 ACP S-malonyltransferase [Enterococcus sp. MMGLQ5-1]NPD37127.1 ACP S-malonyltransferase [Enterococcus sp. MMGLQ5-2]
MSKTVFMFAGQGAQYTGMAKDLYEQFPIVRETFAEANQVIGYELEALIFSENPKLNETQYTQPAILTVDVAIARLLIEKGIRPEAALGLSLGEYAALVIGGAIEFQAAVALIAKRGQYMSEAAPAGTGKMVAVMNTPIDTIETICEQASERGIVAPANYNTPQQIVIGGEVSAVDYAVELLKAAGSKRLIELNVSGPFHTALLKPASEKLAKALTAVEFQALQLPVVSNTTAQLFETNEISSLLTRQVMEPVRFFESINTLIIKGFDTFIEIGPGKTLTGFMKKIDNSQNTYRVENIETLNTLLDIGEK